jgi:hypothetical protein
MEKSQIWGHAAVAALCDSNSEVPVRESNVTVPFVLLLLCVLVLIKDVRDQRSFIREIIVPLQLNLPGIVKLVGFCYPESPDPAQVGPSHFGNGPVFRSYQSDTGRDKG